MPGGDLYVHLLPRLVPAGALRGGVAVAVDVLRASTMILHALAAGCEAVLPCGEIDEARALAATLPRGTGLIGGERHGVPIQGFDLGNSPRSCTPKLCGGKSLVFTTTNGTRAILASLDAERVLIAAFVNLGATLHAILAAGRPVHVVCSGTEGEVSFEDTLLAGALAAQLAGDSRYVLRNDAAVIALGFWLQLQAPKRTLADLLASGRGGRRVTELGLRDDIEASAATDAVDFVAELERSESSAPISTSDWSRPLRIVAKRRTVH